MIYALIREIKINLPVLIPGAGMCVTLAVGFLLGRYHARHNELDGAAQRKIDDLKRDVLYLEDALADSRAECAGIKFALAKIKGAWSKVQRLLGDTLNMGSAIGECTPIIERPAEAKSRRA